LIFVEDDSADLIVSFNFGIFQFEIGYRRQLKSFKKPLKFS